VKKLRCRDEVRSREKGEKAGEDRRGGMWERARGKRTGREVGGEVGLIGRC